MGFILIGASFKKKLPTFATPWVWRGQPDRDLVSRLTAIIAGLGMCITGWTIIVAKRTLP